MAPALVTKLSRANLDVRMTRVMRDGQEYDGAFDLTYSRGNADEEVVFGMVRSGGRMEFIVKMRDHIPRQLLIPVLGISQELNGSALTDLVAPTDALGDLFIGDLVGLYGALQGDTARVLGYCERSGSKRLLVIELDLISETERSQREASEQKSGLPISASALVYVSYPDISLRSIRLFDQNDLLTRSFEDFVFDGPFTALGLKSFRVNSVGNAGHSTFHVNELSFELN
ncbi:MAG: hypothetical protein IH987_14780 [Planctomycetes bacterium]|nr:hypothetical protein [Planctomycetota bacterium]